MSSPFKPYTLRARFYIQALDHDVRPDALWVPLGILEFTRGVHVILQPWPSFGYSKETSNFIAERRVEHTINCKQQSKFQFCTFGD